MLLPLRPITRQLHNLLLVVLLPQHALLITVTGDASTADEDVGEADLGMDFGPPLLLLLGHTDGAEQDIHFLEREALGLREEEIDECGTHEGEETEEDVGSVAHVLEHVGGDLADDEVVHPVEEIR